MDWAFWGATATSALILLVVWQWERIWRTGRDEFKHLGTMSAKWLSDKQIYRRRDHH